MRSRNILLLALSISLSSITINAAETLSSKLGDQVNMNYFRIFMDPQWEKMTPDIKAYFERMKSTFVGQIKSSPDPKKALEEFFAPYIKSAAGKLKDQGINIQFHESTTAFEQALLYYRLLEPLKSAKGSINITYSANAADQNKLKSLIGEEKFNQINTSSDSRMNQVLEAPLQEASNANQIWATNGSYSLEIATVDGAPVLKVFSLDQAGQKALKKEYRLKASTETEALAAFVRAQPDHKITGWKTYDIEKMIQEHRAQLTAEGIAQLRKSANLAVATEVVDGKIKLYMANQPMAIGSKKIFLVTRDNIHKSFSNVSDIPQADLDNYQHISVNDPAALIELVKRKATTTRASASSLNNLFGKILSGPQLQLNICEES